MAWGRRRGGKAAERAKSASVSDVEARGMMLLAMRDHGAEELKKKLLDKQFPPEHVEAVMERFADCGYLDDQRVASRAAASLARQGWGPSQIMVKLRKRRYSSETIDEAIASATEDEREWIVQARERLVSKFHKAPHELDQDERQKAWRHLSYRGYRGATIRSAFEHEG